MKRRALGGAICLFSLAPLVSGQVSGPSAPTEQVPALSTGGGELPPITVTGYVVPRVGDGPQPVTNLSRDFIEKLGAQTVSDVLQRLPINTASFTPAVDAGASFSPGASEVNLYGIGVNSTLVLIDGRRQTIFPFPQNGFQSFVDLNSIPLAAVERIEVLKDGASATYGSDAIGGVVNVILKDEYNGGDLNAYYGITQRGDDEVYHVQLTGGIGQKINDNSKFGIVTAFDYYESSPIDAINRGFAANVNHSIRGQAFTDFRSRSAPAGNFIGLTSGNLYSLMPGTAGPYVTRADFVTNGQPNLYNTVPGEQLLPREQRYGAFVITNYQPLQYLRLYDEFLYQRNEELSSFTATPVLSSDTSPVLAPPGANVFVPATNPFNPFGEDLDPRLRLLGAGQRKTDAVVQYVRNVAGITLLNLPKGWFVDAAFLYAESDGEIQRSNVLTKSGLRAALAGTLPGFVGQFYNPFVDSNIHNTQNERLLNAIKITADDNARTGLTMWMLQAGGELVDVPAGPITLGIGTEYRSDEYNDFKDPNSRFGNVISSGGSGNASGKDYVKSAYGELTIPILGGQCSWPGARLTEIVLAERYDNYSSFGAAWKPKISFRYKPFDDLTFRASYSEGFRAPSVTELFASRLVSFQPLADPVLNSTYLDTLITSGNPKLQPETSYGYYAGLVWSPGSADPEHSWWGWANGFSVYADWVEILKHNAILQVDPQFVLDHPELYPPGQFILREPSTAAGPGRIISVLDPLQNIGAIRVDSFDFGASYTTKEFSWGKLALTVDASYQYHISKQNVPNGQVLNFTDTFTMPDFKLLASIFYTKTLFGADRFQTGMTLNFVDSEHDFNDFQTAGITLKQFVAKTGLSHVHTIGNWTTLDWQISYEFGKPEEVAPQMPRPGYDKDGERIIGEKAISQKPEGSSAGWRKWFAGTKVTSGINNIFDTRPPFADNTLGYDTKVTNALQRFFYISLERKF